MKKIVTMLIACLFLASCSPSPEAIENAIAKTQTAVAQLQPQFTFTPTVTITPEPTLTPTPDIRVVQGDPIDFILQPEDLPKESQFYLPDSSWTGRHSNNEVIQGWGVDEGRNYLARTGRVDGWWVELYRGSQILAAPQNVYCEIVQYETSKGASTSNIEYNIIVMPSRSTFTWTQGKEVFTELGDHTITYFREWTEDSGEKWIDYDIETTYYNYLISCAGIGRKVEVEPEYVANLVEIVLNKMKAVPLALP